jgi:RNA polymerase sigma factor (sigma-70 family)
MQQQERIPLDDSPVAALYQRYAPGLFAYLYRQLASREDAEDLLLEVFLAALEHERFLTLGAKEQQFWLWSVARNKVADHYRRYARRPSVSLTQVAEAIYESEDRAPEQVTIKHEEYRRLYATLRQLPELQQEVLQLRFGHGLNCVEIALILQKSEGAIRMVLSRTLKHLRAIYKAKEV